MSSTAAVHPDRPLPAPSPVTPPSPTPPPARSASAPPTLWAIEHRAIEQVSGPLLVVAGVRGVAYGEVVVVDGGDGRPRQGQVLEVDGDRAVVQVLGGTAGLGLTSTTVRTRGQAATTGVGLSYLGRILDGSGRPRDGRPAPLPELQRPVNGLPLNPLARDHPDQVIETGISAIDGLNTLVRGQKLPIFSVAGLPAGQLAAQVAASARVAEDTEQVLVIFAAMGITRREAEFFVHAFRSGGAAERTVLLLNHADEPSIERLLTPRIALTLAEYFAYDLGRHVLVVMTDMTAYCEALREISASREEMPGRRGYPGYMYTDLASLYERAGRVRGGAGSLTQLPILTMPDGDITHPVPDLTGYITEGQIVLSRELDRQGVDPPIDVLPSLSRLMNAGIGAGRTREDHRNLADQLYTCYARGREVRRLVAIVGEAGLTDEDRRTLTFVDTFDRSYLHQNQHRRTLTETLDLGWQLLGLFAPAELKRVTPDQLETYHRHRPPSI